MSSTSSLAPASSRLGALQRGRGAAARELLTRRAELRDVKDVLSCILDDPRVDRQVEARDRYYAELVVHVGAPIAPLLEKARACIGSGAGDDSDVWLCIGVLEELVRVGYTATEEARNEISLFERAIGFDPDESDAAQPRNARRSFVDSSLPTTELLERATPWNRAKLVKVLGQRRRESDRATIAETAVSGEGAARNVAWEVLARLGDERLFETAVELIRRHGADPELARTRGGDRLGPGRYLAVMRAELVLPLARQWLFADFPLVRIAEQILIRSGTSEDGRLAAGALRTAWRKNDIYRICGSLEILTTTGYWLAAPLVLEIDEMVGYSYARRLTTRFLAHAGIREGITRLVDALWDCEDDTVLIGLEHAPRSAAVVARSNELATSVWHEDAVRNAAQSVVDV